MITQPASSPSRSGTSSPDCCAMVEEHRPPISAYWYRSVKGWHCWQCDGRDDDGWRHRPIRRAKPWPVSVDGTAGWPMPDISGDPCPLLPFGPIGWRPWATWQVARDWYIAFYSCERGHAWLCGYGLVGGAKDLPELRQILVSPHRILPTDEEFRLLDIDPGEIRLRLVRWPR